MRRHIALAVIAGAFALGASGLFAQTQSGLRGGVPINEEGPAPRMAPTRNTLEKEVRNYPEQPPVISACDRRLPDRSQRQQVPHLPCPRAPGESQAPMVSITHFMDREGQFLASISPRRFFCTQCHVPQQEVKAPVENDFVDIDTILSQTQPGGRR